MVEESVPEQDTGTGTGGNAGAGDAEGVSGSALLRSFGVLVGLTAILMALVGLAVALFAVRGHEPETYRFTIPAGTAARLARGEDVRVMPDEVRLKVGDHVIIENRDEGVHAVGPMTVRPGETVDQTFQEPGRFVGACTVQAREVAIVVT